MILAIVGFVRRGGPVRATGSATCWARSSTSSSSNDAPPADLGRSSSRPRCSSSTTPSTTACSPRSASTEAAEKGKSVLFLLEANPGRRRWVCSWPTWCSARASARRRRRAPAIIHFFGGIHEIYFPYVLMKPKLILAMIAGGMTGIFINVLFDVGLRAPAARARSSPSTRRPPSGSYLGVTLSVRRCGRFLRGRGPSAQDRQVRRRGRPLRCDRRHGGDEGQEVLGLLHARPAARPHGHGPIRNVVFACDAGMGSSAMGASVLRKKIQAAGHPEVPWSTSRSPT